MWFFFSEASKLFQQFFLTCFILMSNRKQYNRDNKIAHVFYKPERIYLGMIGKYKKLTVSLTIPRYCTSQKISFPLRISSVNATKSAVSRKLQIWSHLLKKSLMESFTFCAVFVILVKHTINKGLTFIKSLLPYSHLKYSKSTSLR